MKSFSGSSSWLLLASTLPLVSASCVRAQPPAQTAAPANKTVYRDASTPLEARVSDLFSRLTLDEKIELLMGTEFTTRPIPRLGVPPMSMADAGQGVRGGMDNTQGPATAFPSGVAMAASWNRDLVSRIGKAIGDEALNKGGGSQVLLGPAVNIHRSPLGGRNGEYFSEDPFLSAQMGVFYIQGMQSTGCAACVKHFVANNEEVDRFDVNVSVSERALREIYLPSFEAAVKDGHVWTLMTSYNKISGLYASANPYLVTDILKRGWNFDGMVMSDWGGVHETAAVINAGNDLEMPGRGFLKPENVKRDLQSGAISQATIDSNVRRIVRTIIRVGLLDTPRKRDAGIVNSPAHQKLARQAASEGIVLLKNEKNALPLDDKKIKSVAVIGYAAADPQIGAGGSPDVQPFYKVTPLDGIKKRAGSKITVEYVNGTESNEPIPASVFTLPDGSASGLKAEYFNNRNLEGTPANVRTDKQIQFRWNDAPAPGLGRDNWSVRWTSKLKVSKTGRYPVSLYADDGCRLFLDGKQVINGWNEGGETARTASLDLEAGKTYDLRVEYFQAGGLAVARLNWTLPGTVRFGDVVALAKKSDVAVVCIGTKNEEGEGHDRPSMDLPGEQVALIEAVAAVNKRTIVVLNNGTPVMLSPWVGKVPALVETWFPGQEGGSALADVLFGDTNPSGKLPDTFAASREDYPDFGNFPGVKNEVNYAEGIYVGYRHFDKKNIAPIFPFGHGLSYTTFAYGKISVSAPDAGGTRTATMTVKNTGKRTGAEVAQLYVSEQAPQIDRPVRELKGFQKVVLAPGETKTVTFALPFRAFAYCDVPGKQWKADAGQYILEAGASSRDIRQRVSLRLRAAQTEPIVMK